MTAVTRDDTVQHYCSPCSPNPEPSPVACGNLENKGRMDPELEELKSSSACTRLETPGQQCPLYEGIWGQGRTIANGILTAGVDSRKEVLHQRKAWTRELTRVKELRQTPPSCSRATDPEANKTSSSTPLGEKRRPYLGRRLYSTSFFLGRAGRLLVCASCFVRVCLFSQIVDLSR